MTDLQSNLAIAILSPTLCGLVAGYFSARLNAAILASERRILDRIESRVAGHDVQLENLTTRVSVLEERSV